MIIISKNELYVSDNLPVRTVFTSKGNVAFIQEENSMLLMLISLLSSIPTSFVFNMIPTILNLYNASENESMRP